MQDTEWEIYKPKKNITRFSVKEERVVYVSFSKRDRDRTIARICISPKLAEAVGFKAQDKITFNVSKIDRRRWLIQKSDDGMGYTLVGSNKNVSSSKLSFSVTWEYSEVLREEDYSKTSKVEHEIFQGGIKIIA